MDNRRLLFAITISLAILLGWRALFPPHVTHRPAPTEQTQTAQDQAKVPPPSSATPSESGPAGVSQNPAAPAPTTVPPVKIAAARVSGSISLRGAAIDDLVLDDYRDTISPNSPLVRLLEPRSEGKPYFVQYGWLAGDPAHAPALPTDSTVWKASS